MSESERITRREFVKMMACLPYFLIDHQGADVRHNFLTNRDELKKLVALQDDSSQYLDLARSEALQARVNSCGPSTIATVYNIFQHLYGEPKKKIKIGQIQRDVFDKNQNRYFDSYSETWRNFRMKDGMMRFYDLIGAYKLMGFETCDIFGCSYEDMGKDLLVHYEQIDSLMPKINKVFDRGGLLVVFSTAYNGHFVILTDFSPRKGADKRVRDVDLFIIDGKGKNGNGLIGRTSTRLYSPYRWREDGRLVETTGFMGIVGILPGDFGRFKG